MNQRRIAIEAGCNQSDISNFFASKVPGHENRILFVSKEKRERIKEILAIPKIDRLLKYLQSGFVISPRSAVDLFEIYSLAVVISKLRKRGYRIENISKCNELATYELRAKK